MSGYAKLQPPVLSNTLRRDRLISELENEQLANIKWVQAPPGYGKSTLLADYIQFSEKPCYWYQITNEDLDPKNIFNYLSELFAQELNSTKLAKLLQKTQINDLKLFSQQFAQMLFESIPTNFNLVFDDFHIIPQDHIVENVFLQLLLTAPTESRFLFSSRQSIPPRFARLFANQRISLLPMQHIAFNENETRSLLNQIHVTNNEEVFDIALKSKGWAAGIILLADDIKHSSEVSFDTGEWNEHRMLSGYFATEVINNISQEDLNNLSKIANFPFFTMEMAASLCAIELQNIGPFIESLYKKNYFLECRGTDTKYFRFHPLFREFLLKHFSEVNKYQVNSKLDVIKQASELLEEDGQIESAANCLIEFGLWQALAKICIEHSSQILQQGRHEVLISWINHIPNSIVEKYTWLQFWHGKAILPFQQKDARRLFENTFRTFDSIDDQTGKILACAAAAESYVLEADEFISADKWVSRLDQLIQETRDNIPSETEATLIDALLSLLQWVPRNTLDFIRLSRRAEELLFSITDPVLKIHLASTIIRFIIVYGDYSRSTILLEFLNNKENFGELSPIDNLLLNYSITVANFMAATKDPNNRIDLENALEKAKALDMSVFDIQSSLLPVLGSLLYGKLEIASARLEDIRKHISPRKKLDESYYFYVNGWLKLIRTDVANARDDLKRAYTIAQQASISAPLYPLFHLVLLEIIDQNYDQANHYLNRLCELNEICKLGIPWLKAEVATIFYDLHTSYDAIDLTRIEELFSYCRDNSILDFDGRISHVMSPIYQLALEHSIETDHVVKMIKHQAIRPTKTSLLCRHWPWPIKIQLLGQLNIEVNGEEVVLSKKTPKKIISLLKFLATKMGTPVSIASAIDSIWDDRDYVTGDSIIKTTVSRLRKLISKEAVIVENGQIFLNTKIVWVDMWAIKNCPSYNTIPKSHRQHSIKNVCAIYRGDLEVEIDTEVWLLSERESLKSKYFELLIEAARDAMLQSNFLVAQKYCSLVLANEDTNDTAHELQIKLLIEQGKNKEAMSAFRFYQQILLKKLSVRPSPNVANLVKGITV